MNTVLTKGDVVASTSIVPNTLWKHKTPHNIITFEFLSDGMSAQEMFMSWVAFMNAIGYNLNKVEMEEMWNGESNSITPEEVLDTFLTNLAEEGIDHSNDPRFYRALEKTERGE